jgi:hypothetical protein
MTKRVLTFFLPFILIGFAEAQNGRHELKSFSSNRQKTPSDATPRLVDLTPNGKNTKAENPLSLLPNRLYKRYEPSIPGRNEGGWVYDITNSEGKFNENPRTILLPQSTIPANWAGGDSDEEWFVFNGPEPERTNWDVIPHNSRYGVLRLLELGEDPKVRELSHSHRKLPPTTIKASSKN